jgi:hypothetical protein
MKKLLNIKQVSALFGGISPDELQTELDNGGILLPNPHIVAGAKMWWAHQVETSMRVQFGKRSSENDKTITSIKIAISDGVSGFRGGFVSVNAMRNLLGEIPAGPYISKTLGLMGYGYMERCNTSPLEKIRFPKAPNRSRIYHDGRVSGSPATIMALYDAAQRVDMPLQSRQ